MNAIFLLLLASLTVAVVFLLAFIWAVRSGQYEDTVTPSMRPLLDDPTEPKPPTHSDQTNATPRP